MPRKAPTYPRKACKFCGLDFQPTWCSHHFCSVDCQFDNRLKPVESGCIEWQGSLNAKGYGAFLAKTPGTVVRWAAHRFSWERENGKIPSGMYLLHRCDNPACVNPSHLTPGTQLENMQDAASKGRTQRGERHKQSRLKEADVRAIRLLLNSPKKIPARVIAELYSISSGSVFDIKRNLTWSWLE